jgi:hypothetical protein
MNNKTKNLIAINIGIWTIAFGYFISWYEDILPDLYVVNRVIAEGVKTSHSEVKKADEPTYTIKVEKVTESKIEPSSVEDKIRQYFPDNADNMIKLFTCESGLKSETTGDKDLDTTQLYNGELLGKSIGIAQIRTGAVEKNGTVWSRAWEKGLTVAEYENKLRDVDFNLAEAQKVYKSRGYSGWYNCGIRTGLIK